MKNIEGRLQELGKYGYPLDFGTAIEQIINNYKKIALISGLVVLVLVVIFYAIMIAIMGAAWGLGSFTDVLTGTNPVSNSTGILLATLLAQVGVAVIIAPITAGMLIMAHHAETHRDFEFGTAFSMYRSPFLKDIILGTIIISLAANLIQTFGTYSIYYMDTWGISAICTLISYLIYLLTIFMMPLIIFGGLKAPEAIKWSVILVLKRPFVIMFIFILLLIGAFFLGLLMFCIGVLFTLPVIYSIQYILYRTAVGIDEVDELDSLGSEQEY